MTPSHHTTAFQPLGSVTTEAQRARQEFALDRVIVQTLADRGSTPKYPGKRCETFLHTVHLVRQGTPTYFCTPPSLGPTPIHTRPYRHRSLMAACGFMIWRCKTLLVVILAVGDLESNVWATRFLASPWVLGAQSDLRS